MSTNKGNDLARVSKVLNDPADTAEAIAARSDGVFNTGHNVQANAVSNSATNFSNAPQALQVWNMHTALIDRPTLKLDYPNDVLQKSTKKQLVYC